MKTVGCSRALVVFALLLACGAVGCGVSYRSPTGQASPSAARPVLSCSANPTSILSGGIAQVAAKATSPLGLPLTFSFTASSGTISSQGNLATLNTLGSSGTVTVTCNAVDTKGNMASVTTLVIIEPETTSLPPVVSCSANPGTVPLGGSTTVTAVASSPEGRPLTYSWSASSGSILGQSNPAILNTSGTSAGTITVTCGVADDQGRTASATTAVTVIALIAPAPSISCAANPSILNQGGTATISATGQSSQNLALTYSFSASAGSVSGNGASATLATAGLSAGFVTVTCTVDQAGGATASATTQVLLQSITGEQALTAFQFTDSVGVNVHLAYGDSVYATQFPAVLNAMTALGITHYRDGLNQYAPPFQYQNAEALGKAGIKADWLMDTADSAAIINSAFLHAPDTTAGFEGPNEDDADAGATLTTFLQLLHDTVRANPGTASMPILAPSFTQPASFAKQGNLASLISNGNTHDYFGTRNPETAPYGGSFYNCGGYGSMQFNICLAQMVGVNEPVVATETGYSSGVGLSDAVIGRYELRTLFQSLRLGIPRTYLYELVDDPSSQDYGLLNTSFAPRPAYTAIQNTMALLKDTTFAHPGKLDYTLSGNTQNVNHLLLQKSDGTFLLAIWLGVPSADPGNPSTTFNVPAQTVVLSANTPLASSTLNLLDDRGEMTVSPTAAFAGSLSLPVTDRVTMITLLLGQSH